VLLAERRSRLAGRAGWRPAASSQQREAWKRLAAAARAGPSADRTEINDDISNPFGARARQRVQVSYKGSTWARKPCQARQPTTASKQQLSRCSGAPTRLRPAAGGWPWAPGTQLTDATANGRADQPPSRGLPAVRMQPACWNRLGLVRRQALAAERPLVGEPSGEPYTRKDRWRCASLQPGSGPHRWVAGKCRHRWILSHAARWPPPSGPAVVAVCSAQDPQQVCDGLPRTASLPSPLPPGATRSSTAPRHTPVLAPSGSPASSPPP